MIVVSSVAKVAAVRSPILLQVCGAPSHCNASDKAAAWVEFLGAGASGAYVSPENVAGEIAGEMRNHI